MQSLVKILAGTMMFLSLTGAIPALTVGDTTVYGRQAYLITWTDNDGLERTATLNKSSATGFQGVCHHLTYSNGANLVDVWGVSQNPSFPGDSGFGSSTHHGCSTHHASAGTVTLSYQGAHMAVFTWTQTIDGTPETITYVFMDGHDYFQWTNTVDARNGTAQGDSRGPYCTMYWDGASTFTTADSMEFDANGSFRMPSITSGSANLLNGSWTWTGKRSSSQPYGTTDIPYCRETDGGYEVGYVQTQTYTQQLAGDPTWSCSANNIGASGTQLNGSNNWALDFQMNVYDGAKKITWGMPYGYMNNTVANTDVNGVGENGLKSGWGQYSLSIVFDMASEGGVLRVRDENRRIHNGTVTFTAGTGTVKTTGPVGMANPATQTLSPAGYDHNYRAFWVTAAGNAALVNLNLSSGSLQNPTLRIDGLATAPAGVTLNSVALVAGTDYYLSWNATAGEAWITLKRTLTGSNVIQVGQVADYLTLSAPNGGESWAAGTVHAVSWAGSGNIPSVRIELSTNGGSTWTTLETAAPHTGSYSWTVPASYSSQCRIKVTSTGDGALTDASDADFAIVARVADVVFTVNTGSGVHAISPYIYGTNLHAVDVWEGTARNLTFGRMGGDRYTAYNWENNASNAGIYDWGYDWEGQNDSYLGGGDTPGNAVGQRISVLHNAGAAALVTVPIEGYVAADKNGGGDVINTPDYLTTRFRQCIAKKGSAFSLTPNTTDAYSYQDEFVNWIVTNHAWNGSVLSQKIFFGLDNEPDLWYATHRRIHPDPAHPTQGLKATFAEVINKNIEFAGAIKDVIPAATVFGGVLSGYYGYVALSDPSDRAGRHFADTWLDALAAAHASQGRRLVDVFDLHWYPEVRNGDIHNGPRVTNEDTDTAMAALRVQAPRSLWDLAYVENSWIAVDYLGNQAIALIPDLKARIAAHYPGTKLAFTEYYYGGGEHISGAVAQADVLGIFGREDVFAATLWRTGENAGSFTYGGFAMFRNYDGLYGTFGDTSIQASTGNIADTSVYASLQGGNPARMMIVGINKATSARTADVQVTGPVPYARGRVWQLTSASSTPQSAGSVTLEPDNTFFLDMPAMSVVTVELDAAPPCDFNRDVKTDLLWRNTTSGAASVWFLDGTGYSGSAPIATVDPVWEIAGSADFNQDGQTDVFWRHPASGTNSVWLMNGTTPAGSAAVPTVPDPWSVAGFGDFNNDGKPDLLWRNTSSGDNSVWYLNGTTVTGSGYVPGVAAAWTVAGLADFNADGKVDILWRHPASGANSIWYLDGTTVSGGGYVPPVSSPWTVGAVADFNGDRKPDILWHNTSTGDLSYWFMTNNAVTSTGPFTTVPDTTWRLMN